MSISDLKDTFGFSSIAFGFKPSTLNAIYDTMMEVAKMLGISPKSLSHGGTLSFKTVGERVGDETKAQYGPNSKWRITGGTIYLRNSDLQGNDTRVVAFPRQCA